MTSRSRSAARSRSRGRSPARKSARKAAEAATATDDIPEILEYYYSQCDVHRVDPNPHIAVALRTGRSTLGFYGAVKAEDMLPLGDVLMRDETITTLNLQGSYLSSSACHVLRHALAENATVTRVDLSTNNIDRDGGRALASLLEASGSIRSLNLRSNRLHEDGARCLAEGVVARSAPLVQLDVSNNGLALEGVQVLQAAHTKNPGFTLVDDGNFTREEIYNSITHGIGVLASAVFGGQLINFARGCSQDHVTAASIYVASLLALYLSSTLCHSFFLLRRTGAIFNILDHAMINVLIAGSYTPFMMIVLRDTPSSGVVLALVWVLAILGVGIAVMEDKRLDTLRISLYIIMGWMILYFGGALVNALSTEVLYLLVAGGISYTSGVYFFIKGMSTPIYHVLWHLFVLVGSGLHFGAIWVAFHDDPKCAK